MCTMIAQQGYVSASGKAGEDWFRVDMASISYDHPFDMPLEYALNLDFTGESGVRERVAVEMDAASARKLVEAIQQVMKQAEDGGFIG